MARVNQNGDFKEREEKESTREKYTFGWICQLCYSSPSLAPNCCSYGSEYNDVITWGRSLWILCVDRSGDSSGFSMTHFSGAPLIVLPMSVSFWLRGLFPHPCSGRGLLRTDSSVAQSSQHRNENPLDTTIWWAMEARWFDLNSPA